MKILNGLSLTIKKAMQSGGFVLQGPWCREVRPGRRSPFPTSPTADSIPSLSHEQKPVESLVAGPESDSPGIVDVARI